MIEKLLLVSIALLSSACAKMPEPSNSAVGMGAFVKLFERSFETTADNTTSYIRDRRVRVHSDALDGYWFYTQLNTGAELNLYRQRLSHITLSEDTTTIIQRTYGLNAPENYIDGWNTPIKLAALSMDDFKPYFQKGCEQLWKADGEGGWIGYVDPQTCIVASERRNKDIRIESEAYLSNDIYRTNERGYEMDMTFIWGTKPGEMIDLFPIK